MRKLPLATSLIMAAGILISTYLAVRALPASTLAAPVLLALTMIGASMVDAAFRGQRALPSAAALVVALAIAAAWLFMDGSEPRVMAAMLPSLGAAGWAALLPRSRRRAHCNPSQ